MKILAIDIGTGTQDILLFDSTVPVENCVKLVVPSPTQIAAQRIRDAHTARRTILLTGVTQGGGPCHWALNDALRDGVTVYATADAARTFDDDLDEVARSGVRIISDDEARALNNVETIELRDLDLPALQRALAEFGVGGEFDGLALGCLDHGAAPPGYSDRLFRFDHLKRVVEHANGSFGNDLRSFAMLPGEVPEYLTRAHALLKTAGKDADGTPMVFLDTGPAAALGALQDPAVAASEAQLVLNLGNMHALAFHLRGTRIISLYEHHTGEVTREQIEDFSERLLGGTLRHDEVFTSQGHGAYYAPDRPSSAGERPIVAVTGPQRAKLRGSRLQPYFATPHGDMMLSGCFGLVQAFGVKHANLREEIEAALGLAGA